MISNGSAVLLLLSSTLVHSLIIPFLPTCLELLADLLFLLVILHFSLLCFSPGISRSGSTVYCLAFRCSFLFVVIPSHMRRWVRIMHSTGEYVCRSFFPCISGSYLVIVYTSRFSFNFDRPTHEAYCLGVNRFVHPFPPHFPLFSPISKLYCIGSSFL